VAQFTGKKLLYSLASFPSYTEIPQGFAMSSAEANERSYASWRHPFQNAHIYLEAIPFRALTARTLRFAARAEPSEIGGLLWGRIVCGPEGKAILIEQAEFIGADGCLFNSTETGLDHLSTALVRRRNDLEPLGYFRSAVRGDLFPREQDRTFMENQPAGPDSLMLVVEPLLPGSCTAHFYFPQNGRLQMQASLLRVPLVPQPVNGEEATMEPRTALRRQYFGSNEAARLFPPPTELIPVEEGHVVANSDEFPAPSSWGVGRTAFVAALLVAMAAVSIYRIVYTKRPAPAGEVKAAETPIGLQVERRPDGQLDLNWNKNFARFAGRDGARLSIADGPYIRTLELTEDQLLSGKLAYFPKSDDIRFRLDISLGGNRTVGESIRVVAPEGYTSAALPAGPMEQGSASLMRLDTAGASTMKAAAGIVKTDTPGTYVPHSKPPAGSTGKESARVLNPSPQRDRVVARRRAQQPVITTMPPPIDTNQAKAGANGKLMAGLTTPQTLPAGAPPVPVPLKPQAQQTELPVTQPVQAVRPPPVTVMASPLYQIMPNTKPFGYSLVNNDMQIDIQVHIDENGVVRDANPVTGKAGKSTMLTAQALIAARKWRFKPAQVDGRKVPSTYVISFKFRRAL
jgi:TonB family protein